MNTAAGYATAAQNYAPPDQPVEISPFLAMGNAASDATLLCRRVNALADRLTGAGPSVTTKGIDGGSANLPPVFHAVRQTADQLAGDVAEAMRAIDRIERSLP